MDIHYQPGLRAVKSALAVFLCLLVSIPLHRESPFFSCIASIVCMQPTWEKSLRTGFHRFYGTVLGGTARVPFSGSLRSAAPLPGGAVCSHPPFGGTGPHYPLQCAGD